MTDISTASKKMKLNNPTQGTPCGVKENTATQRLGGTRFQQEDKRTGGHYCPASKKGLIEGIMRA